VAKSRLFDCYAYLIVDHVTNFYPFRDAKNHLDSISKLKQGDKIYIKGLGNLKVISTFTDNHKYKHNGKDGLYQEISIKCVTV
jgi:hypothetical protein